MNVKEVCAAAALAGALIMVPPASAQMSESVAAIVNDHAISTFDVRQRATFLLISANIQPTPQMQERARAQALHDLIDERLELQEAARFDINVTADQINRQLNDIAQQNHTTADTLVQQLAQNGVSPQTLRNEIEAEIAWNRLISGLYGSRVRISEDEIRETQRRIAANATRPQYLISEIFLPAENDQEFAEMQNGAMHLLEQMQHGAPFPLVARQFSRAPSAAAGGDIGWIASNELAPELQPVAAQLQPGQVSLPVRTPTGVYIIALRDKHAGAPAGSTTLVSLRQITAPAARRSLLERAQRRIQGCDDLDRATAGIDGVNVIDLGQTSESDLSPAIRDRVANVQAGSASSVDVAGDLASTIVVCARDTGGRGVPSREEIESRLRNQEINMLAERYLRNLRRDATIITRQ
jgi:peptidyl-prolyl cis-trans isomerase SurA